MASTARTRRLRKSHEFDAARRFGRRQADGTLVLLARVNGLDVSRLGLAVGRRVGKAVVRNRVKRRLREAVRLADLPAGWDLVVIARGAAAKASFETLDRSLAALLARAGVAREHGAADAGKEEE